MASTDHVTSAVSGGGPPALALRGVRRRFEGTTRPALDDVTLEVPEGQLCVVIGPSGCGKSTALRMVAGLDEPDSGTVELGGRSMKGVAPQDRDVAMVFQGYALYPHMTAREIMEFPLKMRKVPPAQRRLQVTEAADMLRLGPLLESRPDQMSGGERQRVAMGRAIVRRPRVFLFDEPLSNLDASLRAGIRAEIGTLVRRLGATALYVTHDHVEAMTLADTIVVMRDGRVLQRASPRALYEDPQSSFVATFVGSPRMNLLRAQRVAGGFSAGPFLFPSRRTGAPDEVDVGFRSEHVVLCEIGGSSLPGGADGIVSLVEPLGAETHVTVQVGAERIVARSPGFDAPAVGDRVHVAVPTEKLHLFDPGNDGLRLLENGS